MQIGLAEAIYVRPSDPNQINIWLKVIHIIDLICLFDFSLKAFRDAASSHKSKPNSKTRNNVKTLSRNARRMFAQFNRKKGQIVSHLLDQMANVTGIDDKTRKQCELRGIFFFFKSNQSQVKKYGPVSAGKNRKSLEHGNSISTGS